MADTPTPTATSQASPVLSTATSSTAAEASTSTSNQTERSKTAADTSPTTSSAPTPQSTQHSTSPPDADAAKRTEEARTAFLASLHAVGSTADAGLQARAEDIQANHAVLSKQADGLDETASALAKETARYQKLADETRDKMKDVGDVQNFAEVIERELMVLEETLRIVEEEGEVDPAGNALEGKSPDKRKKRWWR